MFRRGKPLVVAIPEGLDWEREVCVFELRFLVVPMLPEDLVEGVAKFSCNLLLSISLRCGLSLVFESLSGKLLRN